MLARAKAYEVLPQACKTFIEEMSKKLGINVISTDNPRYVVADSDIIMTAPTSKDPVFKGDWLENGCHINVIGSHFWGLVGESSTKQQSKMKVMVDSKEACLKEAGDIIDPI